MIAAAGQLAGYLVARPEGKMLTNLNFPLNLGPQVGLRIIHDSTIYSRFRGSLKGAAEVVGTV